MRKIALVGTAESGKLAPFADKSYEIWGVSQRASYVTRADRWMELHRLDGEEPDWANKWRDRIREFGTDIPEFWMMYPEPDLHHNVIAYPYDRIVARFGTRFMQSTFSWMMAIAIDEMVPDGSVYPPEDCEIAIYGVDMEHGTEYSGQRQGFFHFIELARFLGIKVTRLASGGMSFEPLAYPMWQDDPLQAKVTLRARKTNENIITLNDSIRMTREMMAQNRAVINEIENMIGDEDYDPKSRMRYLQKQLDELTKTSQSLSKDLVGNEAALEEQQWLLNYLAP